MLPPPFLVGQQLPDLLRRFPIRYSCSGTVCLFVWSIGADKPVIVIALPNPSRHAPLIVEIALSALPVVVTLLISVQI